MKIPTRPWRRPGFGRPRPFLLVLLALLAPLGGCAWLGICEPRSVYGPQPCRSDQDCVEEYGEGWYCDADHSYNDGCGGRIEWPICRSKDK